MKNICESNKTMQIELNKNAKQGGFRVLIIAVLALIISIAYIIWKNNVVSYVLLTLAILLLVFGVTLIILVNIAVKKAIKNSESNKIVFESEIEKDHIYIANITNGEQVGSSKAYYKDIIKVVETENYIFLYPNLQVAYPISKNGMSQEDIETIKSWINSARTLK